MSIKDLRSKLKATPVASLESADQALDKALGRESGTNSEFHKMKPGKNIFRLYPPHEATDPIGGLPCTFAEPKVTTFLPAMVSERDSEGKELKDDKGVARKKLGSRPVLNCSIHGKKDAQGVPLSKDLVDEFIRLAVLRATTLYPNSEEDRKKFLLPIYGAYSTDANKRVNGIIYRPTWVSYADKITGTEKKFALLEIGKAVKNRWNIISAIEGGDDPLGTDPFTDADEGRATVIFYNDKATQPSDYYTVEIDSSTEPEVLPDGRTVKVQKTYPLTDDQIEHFYKQPSLAKMYRNAFTRRDLDTQLWGLQHIDSKNNIGVFESDEFQSLITKVVVLYPATESESEEDVEESDLPLKTNIASTFVAAEDHEPKVFTDLPFEDDYSIMNRDELKEFCKDNNTGIIIRPVSVMSDEALREEIRRWEAAITATVPSTTMHEKEEEQSITEESTTATISAKDKLLALAKKKKEQESN